MYGRSPHEFVVLDRTHNGVITHTHKHTSAVQAKNIVILCKYVHAHTTRTQKQKNECKECSDRMWNLSDVLTGRRRYNSIIIMTYLCSLAAVFIHARTLILHSVSWLWVNAFDVCSSILSRLRLTLTFMLCLPATQRLSQPRGYIWYVKWKKKNSCERYLMLPLRSPVPPPISGSTC